MLHPCISRTTIHLGVCADSSEGIICDIIKENFWNVGSLFRKYYGIRISKFRLMRSFQFLFINMSWFSWISKRYLLRIRLWRENTVSEKGICVIRFYWLGFQDETDEEEFAVGVSVGCRISSIPSQSLSTIRIYPNFYFIGLLIPGSWNPATYDAHAFVPRSKSRALCPLIPYCAYSYFQLGDEIFDTHLMLSICCDYVWSSSKGSAAPAAVKLFFFFQISKYLTFLKNFFQFSFIHKTF